jgi:hypothetical protein
MVITGYDAYLYLADAGDDLAINATAEEYASGAYFIEIMTYGWNFDRSFIYSFYYDAAAPDFMAAPEDQEVDWNDPIDLAWDIVDTAGNYTLLLDGEVIDADDFTDFVHVLYEFTGLVVGDYEFTMMVEDQFGYETELTTTITVLNSEITFDFEQDGLALNWTVYDDTILAGEYVIAIDSEQVATGDWDDGDSVIYDLASVTDLTEGEHDLEIIFTDGYDGEATDTITFLYHEVTITNTVTTTVTNSSCPNCTTCPAPPGGIPGYPAVWAVAGFMVIALVLVVKKRR